MSWFNLNDSLNSIKGQITNFASDVLADGTDDAELREAKLKIQQLEELCAAQQSEIETLRHKGIKNTENDEIQPNLKNGETLAWDWKTPENSDEQKKDEKKAKNIADLKKRIAELENAKTELENNIDRLDLDCQQSIDKLITLKDAIQEDCNNAKAECVYLKEYNEKLLNVNNLAKEEIKGLKHENESLKIELEEAKKGNIQTNSEEVYKLDNIKRELEERCREAETKCQEYKNEIEIIKKDQAHISDLQEKLSVSKQQHEKQISETTKHKNELDCLNNEMTKLKAENASLKICVEGIKEENLKLLEIKNAFEQYKQEIISSDSNKVDVVVYNDLQKLLNEREEDLRRLHENMSVLQREKEEITSTKENQRVKILKKQSEELEQVKNHCSVIEKSKNDIHKKYLNILVDSVKKYIESSEFEQISLEDDPNVAEFSSHVENILKLLLDFKRKTEVIEKELYELREEKTRIVAEKNHEIEKLLQNSEILSQEVINKSQTIKDYELECTELMKNNDLLINELESYKNNSGLQTISESNEDNMVLLESQLENANKRIRELELTIADLEKQDSNLEADMELEHIKKQLNITGTELSQIKRSYSELLNKHKIVEEELNTLRNKSSEIEAQLNSSNFEKEELKSTLEKFSSEIENNEYQYTELNIIQDGLKEEVEHFKKNFQDVSQSNKKLESFNLELKSRIEECKSQVEDLQQKLSYEEETRKQTEIQLRNLTEKLQNAKMSETSLKFQLQVVSEAKQNLEINFNKISNELNTCKNEFSSLLEQNETLQKSCFELDKLKISNDDLMSKNTELLKQLEIYETNVRNLENQLKSLSVNDLSQQNEELQIKLRESERRFLELQNTSYCPTNVEELIQKNADLLNQLKISQEKCKDFQKTSNQSQSLEKAFEQINLSETKSSENVLEHKLKEYEQLIADLKNENQKIAALEAQINELNANRNELISMVNVKHQESVAYHNEIQRLSQILASETEKCHNLELRLENVCSKEELQKKTEEIEKLSDQNNFLREKCEVLAQNLLQEQSNVQKILSENSGPSEREQALSKELDRLRAHLVEIEEMYTQELLLAEKKKQEMQAKMGEIEEREKNSSTLYTSVNIRANQQVEALQSQVQLLTNQRDELRKKISDEEDKNNKQAASLANLQFVLEQFQKDKEKDVYLETERIRRQVNAEKQVQIELQKEISNLKAQLEESRQGLQAAARLSDQMEISKQQISNLKEEVATLQEKLSKSEAKYLELNTNSDAKVDKTLIKNLIVGLVSANNNLNKDQMQILKIIATVLDFNQQEHEKVNLNKMNQGSWLSSLLHPQGAQQMSSQSLSEAFVRFLENESKPMIVPNLLQSTSEATSDSTSSKRTTPRQSPIVLSEVVLPTFSDFAQNRNSSSILKDVLKDSS